MRLPRLIFLEILHRKLSFALGVVSASVAVASLVAAPAILQKHNARTLVLDCELARSLPLKVGDKAKLMGREFAVAAVNPERGNKDDITVWINLPEDQELHGNPGRLKGMLALDAVPRSPHQAPT